LDDVGLLAYYSYEWEAIDEEAMDEEAMYEVGLKLSTMKDTDLGIQDDILLSWMKLIEGNDHRLMKAVSRVLDQRRNGHLILLWTQDRHLLRAFGLSLEIGSTSMAEIIQATKAYYLTVEGFLTSNPLLLNLRYLVGHVEREHDIYDFNGGFNLYKRNTRMCEDTLMNGH